MFRMQVECPLSFDARCLFESAAVKTEQVMRSSAMLNPVMDGVSARRYRFQCPNRFFFSAGAPGGIASSVEIPSL